MEDVDPLESLKGKIVSGQLNSGKKFISRLVSIKDGKLFFETRNGVLNKYDLRRIVRMKRCVPRHLRERWVVR